MCVECELAEPESLASLGGSAPGVVDGILSLGGSKKVLPMRSLGSNVGIGLDPDGLSSSLDLMKTVGAFCSYEEPSEDTGGDPEEIIPSEGSEDAETSPPCGASLWLGVEDFLCLSALL